MKGFEDGKIRVIHVGGRGSVNAKPKKHFERILRRLSLSENINVTLLTKDVTRALRLTRDVANIMSARVRLCFVLEGFMWCLSTTCI